MMSVKYFCRVKMYMNYRAIKSILTTIGLSGYITLWVIESCQKRRSYDIFVLAYIPWKTLEDLREKCNLFTEKKSNEEFSIPRLCMQHTMLQYNSRPKDKRFKCTITYRLELDFEYNALCSPPCYPWICVIEWWRFMYVCLFVFPLSFTLSSRWSGNSFGDRSCKALER